MTLQQEHQMFTSRARAPSHHSTTQQGLSLIVVLLSLVTLAFASVALIRSIDTGTLVMGNLGFKKSATIYSDRGADTAIAWLDARKTGATLFNDITANGAAYYATSQDSIDLAGNSRPAGTQQARPFVDWNGDSCGGCAAANTCSACITPSTAATADGFTQRYLITRLCKCAGDPNGNCSDGTKNACVVPLTGAGSISPKRGELKYGDNLRFTGTNSPFFRIIVHTTGPRNTVSLTETYIHF